MGRDSSLHEANAEDTAQRDFGPGWQPQFTNDRNRHKYENNLYNEVDQTCETEEQGLFDAFVASWALTCP